MEKISSETENMRISPTEPTNKGESNESQIMHEIITTLPTNNPTVSSQTSVIVSTGNVTINGGGIGHPSPTNNKKDSSGHNHSTSSSFLTKFRSSKTSHNHHQQQDQQDTTTVQDVNNKKDSDHAEHQQQSKHKKFLSYIRRKAGTKNDNYNRDSRKGIVSNGDNNTANNVTTNSNHNGNNDDNTNATDIGKQEIIEAPIIDAK